MNIHLGGLRHSSFDEGPGSRTVVWLSGCPIRCPSCINPQLFSIDAGESVPLEEAGRRVLAGQAHGDQGISFVGGEPFFQPEALAALCVLVRRAYPPTPGIPLLIVYSGYTYELLRARRHTAIDVVLSTADILIDGPYIAAQADEAALAYRGSRNQRVIDLGATQAAGRIITLDWDRPRITLIKGQIVLPPALAIRLGLPALTERHCGESILKEKGS